MAKARRKKYKPKYKPSLKEVSIMSSFQAMQVISPKLASLMAYQLWFHPGRKNIKKIPIFQPEGVKAESLVVNGKTIRYWCAGQGPTVFLMHGWASCGNQMGVIGQALLEQGFKVVWMDAPAHGESSGWKTHIFEISDSILAVQQRVGAFDTVLAHSFGVPSCLYAMNQGLMTDKFIAISPPATFENLVENFCKLLNANEKTQYELTQRVDDFLGDIKMLGISATYLARGVEQKSLVVHDKHDRLIPSEQGRAVQGNLKNSSFILTEKLGHNKILRDPEIIGRYVDFIKN